MGQIWRELDRREERFVRVEHVAASVFIRTVVRDGPSWIPIPRSQPRAATLGRFNGKRGGYVFVAHPATDPSAGDAGIVTDE